MRRNDRILIGAHMQLHQLMRIHILNNPEIADHIKHSHVIKGTNWKLEVITT